MTKCDLLWTSEILSTYLLIPITEAHSSTQSTPVDTLVRAGVMCQGTKVLTGEVVIETLSIALRRVINNKLINIYQVQMISYKDLTL